MNNEEQGNMKKIGLAGFGFIGSFLYERLKENDKIMVTAVYDPVAEKTASLDSKLVCRDLDELGSRPLDLIVEAAHPDVVVDLWPRIVSRADLMISSMTSLSDPEFRSRMEHEARRRGRRIFLPHGAVLGLDGLHDGRSLLDAVSITTTKHPRNLGITGSEIVDPTVVFEGSTLDACRKFPRNVNVHAAVALAGIGFEATRSIVVADPGTDKMRHHIRVRGKGLKWDLEIESFSAGAVTGSYTPESIYRSLVAILSEQTGFNIV